MHAGPPSCSHAVDPHRFEFLMFPRSPDGRCRKPRLLRYSVAVPLTLLMTAVVVATVGRGQGTGPEGVGTPGEIRVARNTGRRLFDGWFGREKAPEADPPLPHPRDFIPAPQPDPPPPASDRASAAASAAATVSEQPGASGDETPTTVTDEENADEENDEQERTAASGLVWPRNSWNEMKQMAGRVADSARTLVSPKEMSDASPVAADEATASSDAQVAKSSDDTESTESSEAAQPATRVVVTDRGGKATLIEETERASQRPRKPLPPPSAVAPPKTREFAVLKKQVERTLELYKRRPLNTVENTPWEVMHGFIAFGIPSQVRVGRSGTLVNSIGWMNMGGRCRGQVMMVPAGDLPTGLIGYGVQGHLAQYLAILAQCRVAKESPLKLQGQDFTVADLVEQEMLCCRSGVELTFTLIALSHYLPTDAVWQSREGETWDLERLVEEELAQPVRTAACGGTHRLFALSYACQRRREATGSLDGAFKRADKFVREYQVFALSKLQNAEGSFSTEWFKMPANRADDIDRKVQTTGHILEWLVASVDQPMLYHPRIVNATSFLARALASDPNREWKIGPMGHALHALTVYQERVWGTIHPGNIAAFHGSMKAVPNRALAVAEDMDLLQPVLIR